MRLKGKVALATGGGSGIGKAIAIGLATEGARVAINDLSEKSAASVAEDVNERTGRAISVPGDVSRAAEVEQFMRTAWEQLGPIDVLVNNAGVQTETPFLELSEDVWDRIIDTNLKGAFLCSQTVARQMVQRGKGRIINISSVDQRIPRRGIAHYAASKGGILMLTRVMALELAPYGIIVNCVAPGAVATPMNQRLLDSPDELAKMTERIPWGRIAEPTEVVPAVTFLASHEADYVTGSTILVDGGLSMLPWA